MIKYLKDISGVTTIEYVVIFITAMFMLTYTWELIRHYLLLYLGRILAVVNLPIP